MSTTPLEQEPLLELDDIQGNGLAGFNKDFQAFIFLAIEEADWATVQARKWIQDLVPHIATAAEVYRFNKLYRAMRARREAEPSGLVATWINVGFSISGVAKLVSPGEAAKFNDPYFALGMRSSNSPSVGDPITSDLSTHPGHVDKWLFGSTRTPADVMLIVASDRDDVLKAEVSRIEQSLVAAGLPSALRVVHVQWCRTLPPPLKGHEHFGFKDGISQPGIRGRAKETEPFTKRYIDPADSQQQDETFPEQARPGQPLVWPGQFVFGYERQRPNDKRAPGVKAMQGVPIWARNGSYVVCRRLRQDVAAFDRFVADTAASMAAQNPTASPLEPTQFASLLVGRWPSGAPIMRIPISDQDDGVLGTNDLANNHFQFIRESAPLQLLPEFVGQDGNFPQAKADNGGNRCPLSAHIRKVNPRDNSTEKGSPADTLTRLVLRRGIPFGEPLPDRTRPSQDPLEGNRGLMFVCYQTSIKDQFVVLNAEWANDARNPNGGGGHDPLIGQRNEGSGRTRVFELNLAGHASSTIQITQEWIIMTGGDYFFSPGIQALRMVFGGSRADFDGFVQALER